MRRAAWAWITKLWPAAGVRRARGASPPGSAVFAKSRIERYFASFAAAVLAISRTDASEVPRGTLVCAGAHLARRRSGSIEAVDQTESSQSLRSRVAARVAAAVAAVS